jgi:hypothetical protein
MGAGAALAAFASVLQGRGQGQAESDVYKQQLQQRQIEQQAQQQKLLMELQGYQRANAARDKLSPQDQQTMDLGGSIGDIQKRTATTGRAQAAKQQLIGMANEGNRTPDQKIAMYRMAFGLDQNPDSIVDVEKFLKDEGVGSAPKATPFQHFPMGADEYAFEGYGPDGKPKLNKIGPAPEGKGAGKPGPVSWRSETTPDGKSIQVPYERDESGKMKRVPFEGDDPAAASGGVPGKLNVGQQRLVDSVSDIEKQMPDIEAMISGLKNPSSFELAKQYAKYRAPFGLAGKSAPEYTAYFNALGQVQTDLVGAATSGGSRSFQLISMLRPHIPDPTDPPERALEKLKGFDKGRFAAIKATLLNQPSAAAPAAPTPNARASAAPRPPVYLNGKIVGYANPDGKTMERTP